MYHVDGWHLTSGARVEIMLHGRWLPGTVRQSVINPGIWMVQVPVDRTGGLTADVRLSAGLRVRPARERGAEATPER